MQGTQVQPVVRELDPIDTTKSSHGAAEDPECTAQPWGGQIKKSILK